MRASPMRVELVAQRAPPGQMPAFPQQGVLTTDKAEDWGPEGTPHPQVS
jgi:hypothetical protein